VLVLKQTKKNKTPFIHLAQSKQILSLKWGTQRLRKKRNVLYNRGYKLWLEKYGRVSMLWACVCIAAERNKEKHNGKTIKDKISIHMSKNLPIIPNHFMHPQDHHLQHTQHSQ